MKGEVYSWRVATDLKMDLEREARRRQRSVAALLDEAAREWLRNHGSQTEADQAEQARLHKEAEKYIGTLALGRNMSENVRELVRARLAEEYGRKRSD